MTSVYDQEETGLFYQEYSWEGDAPSKLTVISRQTAQVDAVIETDAFFTAHQVRAYHSILTESDETLSSICMKCVVESDGIRKTAKFSYEA